MHTPNETSATIIDAAVRLHRRIGPGLLEHVYEQLLARSLQQRGHAVRSQVVVSFEYDGIWFDRGLRVDLLVDEHVVVELKSAERMAPVHAKQLLTYLKLMNLQVGLLLNFGAATMREGIRRVVNGFPQ